MKDTKKMDRRQVVLLVIACLMGLLVVRKYLPALNLPTEARLQSKLLQLKSLQGDLNVARKNASDRNDVLSNIQRMTEPYWISMNTSSKLEQEINSEFSTLCRKSQLTGTQKVDVAREKPGSILQEITVSLDFKSITMRELTAFLKNVRLSRNRAKYRWDYCKISPDNPRTPKGVNCTLRFKILALNPEAIALLNSGTASPAPADANTPVAQKKNTSDKKSTPSRRTTTSPNRPRK